MNDGNGLVLFDGLDEVPKAQRQIVRRWVDIQMQDYGNVQFILTSRPHGFDLRPDERPVFPMQSSTMGLEATKKGLHIDFPTDTSLKSAFSQGISLNENIFVRRSFISWREFCLFLQDVSTKQFHVTVALSGQKRSIAHETIQFPITRDEAQWYCSRTGTLSLWKFYYREAEEKFGDRVGWRENGIWTFRRDYDFSGPRGIFPTVGRSGATRVLWNSLII